jgi:hypothetical protein
MASVFRPSSPADADKLCSFLQPPLAPQPGSPGFDVAALTWKYWMPRPEWAGSRGYVLEGEKGIEAHCGVLPAWHHGPQGRWQAAHFIDWAADPRTFLAGGRLLRKIVALADRVCAVGGSAATRKIIPMMGFRPANDAVFFARPVRPIRQAFTHQRRSWKLLPRLVRNAWWARVPRIAIPTGWTFEPVEPNDVPAELWSLPSSVYATRERLPATYAYYRACPFARFKLFLLRHQRQPTGCVLLSFVLGQARVADLWLREETPEGHEAAYSLALVASLTDPATAEVIACAAIGPRIDALQRCGFREYRREAIMVGGKGDSALNGFDCQLLDNDIAFLSFGAREYVT